MKSLYLMAAIAIAMVLHSSLAEAKVTGTTYEYEQGGVPLEGWVVRESVAGGARPGVLIVHQWRGLSDYEKKRAEMLAELGYVVFCADIYGKGVRPQNMEEAGAQAGKYRSDPELFRARLNAALDALLAQKDVDPKRIAAIGYCFGGGGVLELARTGAKIAGVVSFHGSFETKMPAAPGQIKAKVLVLHGADDKNIAGDQLKAFEDEMRAAGADYQIVLYGGAVHAFSDWNAGSDPSRGAAYNESADKRSWRAMLDFFEEIFA
ncbi:MAG: dienelactone hydrolase family protein [bacterium]|jgi:dienelactone hydrolase